jgi:cytochrome c-type biogenesis protein CcmF
MSSGNYVIYLDIALAVFAIIFSVLCIMGRGERFEALAKMSSLLLFVTVSFTLLYLYYLFITSDVSIDYVWKYSNSDHPLKYKLSGVLAGMAGSLLFWIWAVTIPWAEVELVSHKKELDPKFMAWTRIGMMVVLLVLLYILSLHNIFKPTSDMLLLAEPDGQGLNPLLQTDLMVIHPPIVFIAYGFMVLPFAAGWGYLATGEKKWHLLTLNWTRAAWFFLTLGIGIGALWAYVVLGWGGYWAWDPVETSSFLPWIMLTGFMHSQLMFKRKGDYRIMAAVLGMTTFLCVIFATFTTRAGGLWVSVHSFGAANLQLTAWERFTQILEDSETIMIYFVFMLFMIAMTGILAFYRYKKMEKPEEEKYYKLSDLISNDMLMLGMVFLSVLSTIIITVMLLAGMNGLDPADFDAKAGVLALAIVLVMMVCMVWMYLGRKSTVMIAGLAAFASLIAYVAYPEDRLGAGMVPILAVALGLSVFKVAKSFNPRRPWKSMSQVSAHLIHLAVVLLLLGYVGSSFFQTEEQVRLEILGPEQEVGDYSLKATSVDSTATSIFVTIEVWKDSEFVGMERPGLVLMDGQTRNEIKVVDTATKDIYLIYQNAEADNMGQVSAVHLTVKTLPLMKCLWGGMWLMAIAVALRVAVDKLPLKKKGYVTAAEEAEEVKYKDTVDEVDDTSDDGQPATKEENVEKDDDYYDSLLEEELKNMEKKRGE